MAKPENPGERGRNMAAQKRQRNAERQAERQAQRDADKQDRDRTPEEEEAPVQDDSLGDVSADTDEGQTERPGPPPEGQE